jgi:hemoglobin
MLTDIKDRHDIHKFVKAFYEKVREDAVLYHHFNEAVEINWPVHEEKITDFWENVIFQSGKYTGNPMEVHIHLHRKAPMRHEHFERWKKIFVTTLEEMFEGPNMEVAKQRALSIATVMEIKMHSENKGL